MSLTTFNLACISRNFLLAKTCICELTCFLVLVLPVRSLIYRAMSSFRPGKKRKKYYVNIKNSSQLFVLNFVFNIYLVHLSPLKKVQKKRILLSPRHFFIY